MNSMTELSAVAPLILAVFMGCVFLFILFSPEAIRKIGIRLIAASYASEAYRRAYTDHMAHLKSQHDPEKVLEFRRIN